MSNFYRICLEKKNISKVILALWLLYLINVLSSKWDEVYQTIDLIKINLDILGENFDESLKKINNDYSDKIQVDYRQILISRGYLLHWGLFLLKENVNGVERYLNILLDNKNLPIVENSFRNLVKYGIVLVLITKSRKNISIIKNTFFNTKSKNDNTLDKNNECYYSLFDALFLTYNLDNVLMYLKECKIVIINRLI
jgi:hypothetical protein